MNKISALWVTMPEATLMGGNVTETETLFELKNTLAYEGFRVTPDSKTYRHHYKRNVEIVDFVIQEKPNSVFSVVGTYNTGLLHSSEVAHNIEDALNLIAHYIPLNMEARAKAWNKKFPLYPAKIELNKLIVEDFPFVDPNRAIDSMGKVIITFIRSEHELQEEDICDGNKYIMSEVISIIHEDKETGTKNMDASGLHFYVDLMNNYVKK